MGFCSFDARIAGRTLLLCLAAASAWAQASLGSLEGVVQDSAGAVIPQADVSVWPAGQPISRARVQSTDAKGRFSLAGLAAGEYSLRAEMAGFKTVQTSVRVEPGRTRRITLTLEIGSVTETIEIGKRRRGRKSPGSGGGFGGGTFVMPLPRPGNESYAGVEENGFLNVRTRPLSTFSIDVDTASYANVRRFLLDGTLPPADAVRVEELINYFRYDDPAPSGDAPFAIGAETARCPWAPERRLARITLRSEPIPVDDLPPSNLTFLVDVSGSMMSHDKLPLLKRGLAMLVEQLRPEDRVAIVVYAGAAGRVLEPTSGRRRDKILAALERLQAGGSTAGAAGIRLAYETARESFSKKANNRVILATDGDFNVGVSSDKELVRLIERERDGGIFLTVLGFGTGNLKDAKLEGLADHGNGNYAYIDSILEARRALVEQMGSTLVTVAKDVKLQVEFNPARVEQYRLVGYENRLLADEDFADDTKDAGEMGAGHVVTALYEIVPRGGEPAAPRVDLKYQKTVVLPGGSTSGELATVKVRYKPPKEAESLLVERVVEDRDVEAGEASDAFRLAAAVAEFGMLLRDSEHKGAATFDSAAELARSVGYADEDGRVDELTYLIRTAGRLAETKEVSQSR